MSFWNKFKEVMVGDAPEPKEKKSEASPQPVVEETVEQKPVAPSGDYRRVRIERGKRGWGGPLVIEPKPGKDLIYCVTGGGIHPVAERIVELTGGRPFDGFRSKAAFEEIAVAVIDCGGTARVGVYPMKGVLTVDIHSTSPAGPLMKFIKEDNFVSGVTANTITLLDE